MFFPVKFTFLIKYQNEKDENSFMHPISLCYLNSYCGFYENKQQQVHFDLLIHTSLDFSFLVYNLVSRYIRSYLLSRSLLFLFFSFISPILFQFRLRFRKRTELIFVQSYTQDARWMWGLLYEFHYKKMSKQSKYGLNRKNWLAIKFISDSEYVHRALQKFFARLFWKI